MPDWRKKYIDCFFMWQNIYAMAEKRIEALKKEIERLKRELKKYE